MDKKGVEITFNWIFVIISGSILLFFFMYFAFNQIDLFNKIGINEVTANINDEIDAFSIGISSSKTVEMPKNVVFNFKCGEVIYKDSRKDTLNLIYGKDDFRSKFNLWTKAWIFPFKIDNLYYASNSDKKFFVIGDDNFLFDIPDKFKKSNKLEDVKKEDIIVEFTNTNIFSKYNENKVLAINRDAGLITFYPEKQKEEFYGDAMILGSMFTDFDDYKCLKEKSLVRLGLIADLYKEKIEFLKLNSKCGFQYNQIDRSLDLFKKEPLKYYKVLEDQNNQLKRDGCIGVF